jgi:hypothetical protein
MPAVSVENIMSLKKVGEIEESAISRSVEKVVDSPLHSGIQSTLTN